MNDNKTQNIILGLVFIGLCLIAFLSSVNPKPTLESYFSRSEGVKTGGVTMIPIETPKGRFNVWTKRFGNNPKIKVLLLHGGPGGTHDYFESAESFLPLEGIEFIYYDQLGSGNSDNPDDASLWDLPRYVEEVEQVRKALNLDSSNFYLLGHSWGGILAIEYALKYQSNLKGLIISNMMASIPQYNAYANNVLAKQMDPKILDLVRGYESRKEYENPKYMEILVPNFYSKHIYLAPASEWAEPVNRGFAKLNRKLYVTMQGPSEFGALEGCKLFTWDRTADLNKITASTLVIGALHDTMDPQHMEWMAKQIPNGQYLQCSGGHMAMWDDQETYYQGLIRFLKASSK